MVCVCVCADTRHLHPFSFDFPRLDRGPCGLCAADEGERLRFEARQHLQNDSDFVFIP